MTTHSRKRRWTQWTETEARTALDDWRASGLGAHAFAKQRGVSAHRLTYWRQRLAPSSPLAFVPVLAPTRGDARIEIVREGVVLRLRESIEPAVLARIVDALARVGASC